jgi:hypothetical protein
MKTLFTYLTMIVLFIIGTRLVAAQQKYTRSRQELVPVESKTFPFQQYLQLASHSVKETYEDVNPTTDAISDEQTVDKSPNRKTTVALKATVKIRKSIKGEPYSSWP